MMNYFLLVVFLFAQNVVFSSSNDKINGLDSNVLYDFRKEQETITSSEFFLKTLNSIKRNNTAIAEIKSPFIDIVLFVLLKKFPDTFTNAMTKVRKEFTLETIFDSEYAALCTIKNVKIYPENLLIVKYILKDQEDEQVNEIIGAKRFIDMPDIAIYDCIKDESYLTKAYRKNHNDTLMWFAPDDSDDDLIDDNFEQEDHAGCNTNSNSSEYDENSFLILQLYDGIIKNQDDDWIDIEDIIDDTVCTFQDGKLFFQQNENIIRTFDVLPQQDGRYVRRTKADKIKYFFVENETDSQDAQLLLLKKTPVIINALPVLQIGDGTESCRIIDFFRKYGINDIRQGENKNSLYIQSMDDKKYHQFTVVREKNGFSKNYIINTYDGIYDDYVSQFPKEYPFSNWLKLQFSKSDDSTVPGTLELLYGDESVPLPLDDVIEISSAKCSGNPGDLVGGTNVVFKTTENKWYQFSTNGIIDSLLDSNV